MNAQYQVSSPLSNSYLHSAAAPEQDNYEFRMTGQTQRCTELIATRQHVMIGISPFNSRFSTACRAFSIPSKVFTRGVRPHCIWSSTKPALMTGTRE
jgi:Cyclodipeptide synthase